MFLVVDIGNSFTKFAFFLDDKIKKTIQFDNSTIEINSIIRNIKPDDYVIISSVSNKIFDYVFTQLNKQTENILVFSYKTKIPIKNKYSSPKTLGLDRLAAIIGANSLFPNGNILVFDAGTALTIDFINEKNEYLGGNISLGINTRFKALNNFTDKLPLINKTDKFKKIGETTEEAIVSGVQKGILYEVDSYIDDFKKNYNNLKVIFTGGDSFFFEKNLKNTIFANSNIVSIGLYKVLKFNV